jgi:hypothetical protein
MAWDSRLRGTLAGRTTKFKILEQENVRHRKGVEFGSADALSSSGFRLCQSLVKPHHFGDIDVNGTVPPAGH